MINLIREKKIYAIIFSTVFFIMVFSIIFETNILHNLYVYVTDSNYRNMIMIKYNNFQYFPSLFTLLLETWRSFEWHFDYIIVWGTNIFQLILPFFAVFGAIIYDSKNKNEKGIFLESFKIAFVVFLAFLTFYVFSIIFCHGQHSSYITRELFVDIFGRSFYYNHLFLYYLLEGIVKFFLMPFLYISSGILLSLSFGRKKLIYNYIIILYFFLSIIFSTAVYIFGEKCIYFNPMTIMVASTYVGISTPLIVLTNLQMPIFSLFVYKKKEKRRKIDAE